MLEKNIKIAKAAIAYIKNGGCLCIIVNIGKPAPEIFEMELAKGNVAFIKKYINDCRASACNKALHPAAANFYAAICSNY